MVYLLKVWFAMKRIKDKNDNWVSPDELITKEWKKIF